MALPLRFLRKNVTERKKELRSPRFRNSYMSKDRLEKKMHTDKGKVFIIAKIYCTFSFCQTKAYVVFTTIELLKKICL